MWDFFIFIISVKAERGAYFHNQCEGRGRSNKNIIYDLGVKVEKNVQQSKDNFPQSRTVLPKIPINDPVTKHCKKKKY